MQEKYINLIANYKRLDISDKREEIINNLSELLKLLYLYNKNQDDLNEILPVLPNYEDENEFLDSLFTYIISLKEETAKLIENVDNN